LGANIAPNLHFIGMPVSAAGVPEHAVRPAAQAPEAGRHRVTAQVVFLPGQHAEGEDAAETSSGCRAAVLPVVTG